MTVEPGGDLTLDALSGQMEEFVAETTEEYYRNGAGLKEELELSPIYERHAALFERSVVDWVRRERDHATSDDHRRRLAYLLDFVADGFLEHGVREMADRLVTRETQAVLSVDGEEVPYRALSVKVANEPDRARRERMFDVRQAFVAELNPDREGIWSRTVDLARQLGYPTTLAMYRDLKGVDFEALGRTMREFLERTEAAYQRHFGPALKERAGVELGKARKHDVAWMLRATDLDGVFPRERLIPALESTLKGLGIDIRSQSNVLLDTEPRPMKSPRAFCAPVRVPSDVRLVILPHGGQDDYHSLLHEAGHTEHFAHTRQDLPAEFRCLGDNAVTESFAFLFEYLTLNPLWLEAAVGATPAQAAGYLEFERLDRLYFLRRYAGKLLYELELHQARSLSSMPARYDAILTRATGVQYGPVDYLADVDAALYVAEYLRAWALERMMRQTLMDRFGRDWWRNARAGEFLRELWSWGQRDRGDEVARRLGFSAIDFEPLTRELAS